MVSGNKMESKKYIRAQKELQEAHQLMNKVPLPWTDAQAIPVVKKLQKALALYNKVIELEPDNLSAQVERAEIKWYPFISDTDGCMEDLRSLIKQFPDNAGLHALIGDKWSYLNNYQKAIDSYLIAVSKSGFFLYCGILFIYLADAYRALENYFEAIECYTNAIELLDETDFLTIDVYYHRGFCFKKIGWLKGAEMDYREFEKYKGSRTYEEFENYLEGKV